MSEILRGFSFRGDMIGEKIGYKPVRPYQEYNEERELVRTDWCRFDYNDAAYQLEHNQSYSQALIALAASEGKMPEQLSMAGRQWLVDGLLCENDRLAAAGLQPVDPATIRPQL